MQSKDLASGEKELGLSGTLDDADEYAETMESLKSAEFTMGKKMKAPEVNSANYQKTGSKVESILDGSKRIAMSEIEEGMKSKEEEVAHRQEVKKVDTRKLEAEHKKEEQKVKQAFNQMAIHFQDQDMYDESWD